MFKKYAKFYDCLYSDKPYRKEIQFIYSWANCPKSILDIGAGTASYWDYFPEKAMVVGIEKSGEMIKKSKHSKFILEMDILDLRGKVRIPCIASEMPLEGGGGLPILLGYPFDAVTALFDVINYIPDHSWWEYLPLKQGGYFIFDIWDYEKVMDEGFNVTTKKFGKLTRTIYPFVFGNEVRLRIEVEEGTNNYIENHVMYLFNDRDIKGFCRNRFEVVDKRATDTWQTWYKLKRL